jgi:hypothetical protein
MKNTYTEFQSGNLNGRDDLGCRDGRIILKWILKKQDVKMWTERGVVNTGMNLSVS